jgi:hypothetical protein
VASSDFSKEKAASFSTAAYSFLIFSKAKSQELEKRSFSDGSRMTDAQDSRGMAFRRLPPSMETSRKGTPAEDTCHKILASSFIALPRP